jgi:hypothetical protein
MKCEHPGCDLEATTEIMYYTDAKLALVSADAVTEMDTSTVRCDVHGEPFVTELCQARQKQEAGTRKWRGTYTETRRIKT